MLEADAKSVLSLLISVLLHAVVAVALIWKSAASAQHPELYRERADGWQGETFEIDAVSGTGLPPARATDLAGAATPAPAPASEPERASPKANDHAAELTTTAERAPKAPQIASADERAQVEHADQSRERRERKHREAEQSRSTQPPMERARPERESNETKSGGESETAVTVPVAGGSSSGDGAKYGAEGTANGVRSIGKAFTRAIPPATSRDRAWTTLPFGAAGTLTIEITIDEDGHISQTEPKGTERPPHLLRLVDRTVLLLKGGRFALSRDGVSTGTETLRLDAEITSGPPSDNELANPADPFELGFEPPTDKRPGRAFFRLASGRRIEVRVKLEPAKR